MPSRCDVPDIFDTRKRGGLTVSALASWGMSEQVIDHPRNKWKCCDMRVDGHAGAKTCVTPFQKTLLGNRAIDDQIDFSTGVRPEEMERTGRMVQTLERGDLLDHETLEAVTAGRRSDELLVGADAEQIVQEAGVAQIDLRRLDQPPTEIGVTVKDGGSRLSAPSTAT